MQVKQIMACALCLVVLSCLCVNGVTASDPDQKPLVSDAVSQSVAPPHQAVGQGNSMSDIVDIKPIEKIGYDTRLIRYVLYALGALVIIILLLYLLDILIRKRKKDKHETVVMLPVDQLALKNLDDLEAMGNIEPKEYYFTLTAIIRNYIKGRFALDAPEMTTEELLPRIASLSLDKHLALQLKDLLKSTDPIKFAGVFAGQEKIKHDMTFARRFVESTRSIPEQEETEDKAKENQA